MHAYFSIALAAVIAVESGNAGAQTTDTGGTTPVVLIVLDGLRPDYVTPELMPRLCAFVATGVVCENHHAIVPTVTRGNSAAIAAGAYPEFNGLMDNVVYFPEISPMGIPTSDGRALLNIDNVTGGRLLTTKSMGEWLEEHGKRILVLSSGSTGSALLQNHKVKGYGVAHPEMVVPESLEKAILDAIGPAPEEGVPNDGRNHWVFETYHKVALDQLKPDLTVMWISDPDHTAHKAGIGAPLTKRALKMVDDEFGRVLDAHADRGLAANVIVMSDHGFSTGAGGAGNVARLLKESGLDDGTLVIGGGIYVNEEKADRVPEIVRLLQAQPWIGAVCTRAAQPGAMEGAVPGTLSFDAIRWGHERAADIWFDLAWSDQINEFGFPGATTSTGTAGHGAANPYEIHNVFTAAGPGFKRGLRNAVPTGNVDVAPTICRLLVLPSCGGMQGRVIEEVLAEGPDPSTKAIDANTVEVSTEEGAGYRATAHMTIVDGKYRYLDYVKREH